jgi:HSP20 family protein
MDLCETKENELIATFELPGMSKEDVSIDVHPNRLTVSGQSTVSNQHEQDGYAVRERRFGKFTRTLPLPPGVKARGSFRTLVASQTDLLFRLKT